MIDTFYILDFDHCLGNTNKLQEVLQEVIERETGIHPHVISKAREEYRKNGGSFDTATYVKQLFDQAGKDSEAEWQTIETLFIRESQVMDMLEPYAEELLRILQERQLPFGVVTYGGKEWQEAKLAASGLMAMPHLVTDVKEKGYLLSSWRQADKTFLLPDVLTGENRLQAKNLVFIDDNPVSFVGIPTENITPICAMSADK